MPLMSERVLAKIQEVTPLPVTHIVISHWHGDHNLGIHRIVDAFPSVEVIGHTFTRSAMLGSPMNYARRLPIRIEEILESVNETANSGKDSAGEPLSEVMLSRYHLVVEHEDVIRSEYNRAKITPPTLSFDDALIIHSGSRTVELRYLGDANTAGDIVMWLPEDKIVATGDMVVFPTPYGFNVPPRVWAETLRNLKALGFETLVPGHGEVQRGTAYVDLLIETAESIANQTDELIAQGLSNEEVEAKLDFSAFRARYTGGDEFLENRWEAWFEGPFRKAALKALTGEPMVVIGPPAAEE